MNRKLEKLEGTYWKIAKIISVLFVIINYQLWTEPYSFIKSVLLIIGIAVGIFIAINVLDMIVGLVTGIIKYIHRKIKNKRVLKDFYESDITDEK
ncbi:MAG: hypothetical protein MR384_00725 [Lachnospiraceae bacterium]|nr:hypothetical protein [Lachnospiraceae bacterium]